MDIEIINNTLMYMLDKISRLESQQQEIEMNQLAIMKCLDAISKKLDVQSGLDENIAAISAVYGLYDKG